MTQGGIEPSLDQLKDRHARLRLGLELASVEQLTFQCGEETLAQGVIIGIPDRAMDRRMPDPKSPHGRKITTETDPTHPWANSRPTNSH